MRGKASRNQALASRLIMAKKMEATTSILVNIISVLGSGVLGK